MDSEQELAERIVKVFEILYRKTENRPRYRLKLESAKQDVILANFIARLRKHFKGILSIGSHTLIEYFIFQFQYWDEKETERRKAFGWYVGKKAFERWKTRHEFHYYISNNGLIAKYEINLRELYREVEQQPKQRDPKVASLSEQIEKFRYLNTELGLNHCIDFTTLYTKTSPCTLCKFREACKDVLRNTHPQLYYARLYREDELPEFLPF